jgi:thioredoxin reductase/SAM-dependent methyltransferase
MNYEWDVVVIGGGVAGISAALMLGRAQRRVLVIDAGAPRNRFATQVHGVLGHEGVDPIELVERGRVEAVRYGVTFESGTVDRVLDGHRTVTVVIAGGGERVSRALVVATGVTDELPPIPGLTERWGRTVLHCPYCHGWEVRSLRLGVLTTSPLSRYQAELVRQWSDHVTVFTAGLGSIDAGFEQRLRARGLDLISSTVTEVVGSGEAAVVVRTQDGRETALDALFTAGTLRPHDEFLAPLTLARTDGPFGSFLEVDPMGRTSHERIWAAGNVVTPGGSVPLSLGAGNMVGAAVNATLVAEDFDTAVASAALSAPVDYWDARYGASHQVWSGAPNAALADSVASLDPGSALDLGCGEGADVIWLAEQGWDATGIDISSVAVARARAAAADAGVEARFVATDLSTWAGDDQFDLVAASFFHSPVELERTSILRAAAQRVALGGHLLVISHLGVPPAASGDHGQHPQFLAPDKEIAALELPGDDWLTVRAEARPRIARTRDGQEFTLEDGIVLLRRVG